MLLLLLPQDRLIVTTCCGSMVGKQIYQPTSNATTMIAAACTAADAMLAATPDTPRSTASCARCAVLPLPLLRAPQRALASPQRWAATKTFPYATCAQGLHSLL